MNPLVPAYQEKKRNRFKEFVQKASNPVEISLRKDFKLLFQSVFVNNTLPEAESFLLRF